MGSRTAQGTKRELALRTACVILVCVGAGSCVLGNDSDRPVLAVDLIWDDAPGSGFLGASCDRADVGWMTWDLQDRRGRSLKKSEGREECLPLDFIGLSPGTYQLVVEGFDKDEELRWSGTCSELDLSRFDVLYQCEVEQIAPDDSAPDDKDAGTADAG